MTVLGQIGNTENLYNETAISYAASFTVPNASSAAVTVASYTLPATGLVYVTARAGCQWVSISQRVTVDLATSTPAPDYAWNGDMTCDGQGQQSYLQVPVFGYWGLRTAGTLFTLRCRVLAGTGGTSVVCTWIYGHIYSYKG